MKYWRRPHRVTATAVVAMALIAGACGGDDADDGAEQESTDTTGADGEESSDEGSSGDAVSGGSVSAALEAETDSWRPGSANYHNSSFNVAFAIYDPLVLRDEDGGYQPYLAESIEPNDDFTVWTLTLRDGVEFHDGTPLNAEALHSNFTDYLLDDESEVAGPSQLGQVEELAVIDDLTVEYRLVGPNAAFPDVLTTEAGFPFSPDAAADDPNGESPVGTGPFVFDEWVRDSELRVVRNEDYWQNGLPYLDEIVFRPIPDADTREQALAADDIDAMLTLTRSQTLQELDGVEVHTRTGNVTSAVIFNNTAPPFDDVRVRRALSMAVDTEQLMIVHSAEGEEPATQMFSPENIYHSEDAAEITRSLQNDPDGAREELQGYLDDPERSDGKEPGEPLEVEFSTVTSAASQESAQLYQAFWSDIGVDVSINTIELATLTGQARSKEYQAQGYRVGKEFDAGRALGDAFGEGSSQNFTGYTNPEVTELLDQLRREDDPTARQEIVGGISVILAEEVPQLYSSPTVSTWAADDRLGGIDSWRFPDGTEGAPVYLGTLMWGHVWAEE